METIKNILNKEIEIDVIKTSAIVIIAIMLGYFYYKQESTIDNLENSLKVKDIKIEYLQDIIKKNKAMFTFWVDN